MKPEYLSMIDHSTLVSRQWIRDLCERTGWDNEQRAYRLLRVGLHGLRDLLSVNEAVQLSAQMPVILRGLYFEGWQPAKTPSRDRHIQALLDRLDTDFASDPLDDTKTALAAVFDVLSDHISAGEIEDVRASLPKEVRDLWPL